MIRIYSRPSWVMLLAHLVLAQPVILNARPLEGGRLTHVVREVVLRDGNASSASASLHAVVRDGSVRTGANSHTELTFQDQTIARLSHKTELAVHSKSRTFELLSGAALTQVPMGVGGTKLKAANATAIVTGTTVLVEHYPNAYTKFIVLDGNVRLCLEKDGHAADCVLLRAGQLLIANPGANALPQPVDVDLARLNRTCHLLTDFPALPREDLLNRAVTRQRGRKTRGGYAETNLVIFGRGTLVNLIDSEEDVPKAQQDRSSASPSPNSKSKSSP